MPLLLAQSTNAYFGLSSRNETHTAKFKSAAILALLVSVEMVQSIPTRARGLSMRTHLTAVEPEVAILGADQKERGLWGQECVIPVSPEVSPEAALPPSDSCC